MMEEAKTKRTTLRTRRAKAKRKALVKKISIMMIVFFLGCLLKETIFVRYTAQTFNKPESPVIPENVVIKKEPLQVLNLKQEAQKAMLSQFASDERLLAQVAFCEAGATNADEMVRVISVFIRRALTKFFRFENVNTLQEVLHQPGEYGPETIRKVEEDIEPPELCNEMARKVLDGTVPLLEEGVLFQVLHELDEQELADWKVHKADTPGSVHNYYIPDEYVAERDH